MKRKTRKVSNLGEGASGKGGEGIVSLSILDHLLESIDYVFT
jgi:hypothetical protein